MLVLCANYLQNYAFLMIQFSSSSQNLTEENPLRSNQYSFIPNRALYSEPILVYLWCECTFQECSLSSPCASCTSILKIHQKNNIAFGVRALRIRARKLSSPTCLPNDQLCLDGCFDMSIFHILVYGKEIMHFSAFFSLFGAISSHILIGRCESQSLKYIPSYADSDITTLFTPSRPCLVPGSKQKTRAREGQKKRPRQNTEL